MLKFTKIELELLTDPEILLFIESAGILNGWKIFKWLIDFLNIHDNPSAAFILEVDFEYGFEYGFNRA